MNRWVDVKGTQVKFGNVVSSFVGSTYTYECSTESDAISFGKFVDQRDPGNENMPIAITDTDMIKFNAKEIIKEK